jgi:predicted CopG family antitoxin
MATKTISIDLEAYERLNRARLGAAESFSRVIKRATWQQQGKTCGALLAALTGLPVADEAVLKRIEAAQAADSPPDDPRA